jgi:integrase
MKFYDQLTQAIYQAQVDELIASNPAARFGRFFDARHDPREHVTVLDAQDVAKILKAAAKWYPDYEVLVATLFYTGMREGEALGLKWQDFDWQRNLVDLRRTIGVRKGGLVINTPKSGKLRTVDLPSFLTTRVRELKSIRGAQAVVDGKSISPWVFPALTDTDKPLNASWFWRHVWSPVLDKAEVRHIRVHDARHTYASMMLRRGVPIAYVSNQLGHSSIQVTVDLYGHFIPGEDRHHVESMAEAIEEARAQESATQPQPERRSAHVILPQVLNLNGAPGVTRTPGTQFRKLLLYPPELRGREELPERSTRILTPQVSLVLRRS